MLVSFFGTGFLSRKITSNEIISKDLSDKMLRSDKKKIFGILRNTL